MASNVTAGIDCWDLPFHHKLLTLRFTGYLITTKDWKQELQNLTDVPALLENKDFEGLTNLFKREPGLVEFVDSTADNKCGTDVYRAMCKGEISTEYERYKSFWDPDTEKETMDEVKGKYAPDLDLATWVEKDSVPERPTDKIPDKDMKTEIEERSQKEFKIVFGRRDHHLVASLVEALWDMKEEKDIRIAHVPREQLLSVDMEQREIRELTLQLHPNKPVYKRRDQDEIRAYEEPFIGAMPWCRVPGGRNLPPIIDGNDYKLYKEISGRGVETMWTEDKWLMSERKRLYRQERKKDKDKAIKVTDANDQVNHYLPILKEISGFSGLIRDDEFYEGLQGLIYILQVARVEDPPDLNTHFERLTSKELEYRRDLKAYKREKREKEKKKESEKKS